MIFLLGLLLLFTTFGYLMLLWRLWLVDGTLDTAVGMLLGGGALLLVGMGIRNHSFTMLWVLVALMGGGSILYLVLEAYEERTSMRRRQLEDVEKLKLKVQYDPGDWRAWRDLAQLYTRLEKYNHAIRAYKNAIKQEPPDAADLRYSLNVALNLRKSGKMRDISLCPNCKEVTPRSSKNCIHCGAPMRFNFLTFISTPDEYGESIRFIVLGISGVGIFVLVFSQFPLEVKAVIAMATVVVCAFLIWRSIDNV